jgi:type II secretory pathway component PulF
LRAIVVDAIFYPAVVLGFGFILFGFLCFFVLPRFEEIFKDFGVRLPAITNLALALSQHPLQRVVIPVLAVVLGLIVVRQVLHRTAWGRRLWARWIYAIPIAGTLTRSARLAAFTDLLAILIDHELPLPEAFRLAGEASSDPIMANAARQVHQDLSQGMPLGEVLRGRSLVPEWVSWMAGLGERRGTLGTTLHQVAEMYRRQVDIRAALLRSVLAPFLIVCTAGLFAVLFIMAIMLPISRLLEALSK